MYKVAAILILIFSACTKKADTQGDPKERLIEFIDKSFKVKKVSDKNELSDYLIGEAKERLKNWSTEQFAVAFIDKKRSPPKFKLREIKHLNENEVNIDYELSFTNEGDGESYVINRKSCQMIREDEVWYIAKCRNLKQVVEYRQEIEVLPSEGG